MNKIRAVDSFIQSATDAATDTATFDVSLIKRQLFFTISLRSLHDDVRFGRAWPNFDDDLADDPKQTLNCIGLAMHQRCHLSDTSSTAVSSSQSKRRMLEMIRVRLTDDTGGAPQRFCTLKANSFDRLITVHGTVIRAGAPEFQCTWMAFKCLACNAEQAIRQLDGLHTQPTKCRDKCQNRTAFVALLQNPYTQTEAFQVVRLKETMEQNAHCEAGRIPDVIDVELSHDLVDVARPGDDVLVTGILNVHRRDELPQQMQRGRPSVYRMYLEAVSVTLSVDDTSSTTASAASVNATTTTVDDNNHQEMIEQIASDSDPFRLLVHSLCPTIYGHEMIKAGLLLGLLGGSANSAKRRRAEAHVLVVGDPGLGKSQMLRACAQVSPRGVFVCGNSNSSVGLTVSVRNDKGESGGGGGGGIGGALEAGALLLADQGACCIDEFDKMCSGHHEALLEAMEQQTVSVAKAGIMCTLQVNKKYCSIS